MDKNETSPRKTCSKCNGEGAIGLATCNVCGGRGFILF